MCVDLDKLDKAAWNSLNQLRFTWVRLSVKLNCLDACVCVCLTWDEFPPLCTRMQRLHLLRHRSATLVIQAVRHDTATQAQPHQLSLTTSACPADIVPNYKHEFKITRYFTPVTRERSH